MFLTLKHIYYAQKKLDNMGQTQSFDAKSNSNYINGSIVEYLRSRGIKSENTTHEKEGQTTLMLTNNTNALMEDISIESSIRYLKFRRFRP